MLGVTAGTAVFVFHISRAASYMSDEPETCMNCHVMTTQYLTWQHSSHARVATCNDCHVPHDNAVHNSASRPKTACGTPPSSPCAGNRRSSGFPSGPSRSCKPIAGAATATWWKRWRLRPTAATPIASAGTAIAKHRTARFAACRRPPRFSSRGYPMLPKSTRSRPSAADRPGPKKSQIETHKNLFEPSG